MWRLLSAATIHTAVNNHAFNFDDVTILAHNSIVNKQMMLTLGDPREQNIGRSVEAAKSSLLFDYLDHKTANVNAHNTPNEQ